MTSGDIKENEQHGDSSNGEISDDITNQVSHDDEKTAGLDTFAQSNTTHGKKDDCPQELLEVILHKTAVISARCCRC